jgi:hypothetical protein
MIAVALFSFALGRWLSRRKTATILLPATPCIWIVAAIIAHFEGLSLGRSLLAILLCSFCLQSGYLAGLAVSDRRLAKFCRRVAVALRR